MTTKEDIKKRINELTKRHGQMNCYLFALVMTSEFGGKIIYNHDHCLVNYHGDIYDQVGFYEGINKHYDQETRDRLIEAFLK